MDTLVGGGGTDSPDDDGVDGVEHVPKVMPSNSSIHVLIELPSSSRLVAAVRIAQDGSGVVLE